MLKQLLLPEIEKLIETKDWRTLKVILTDWPMPDVADLLESMDESEMVIVFRLLSRSQAADVFSEFNPDKQLSVIEQLSNDQIKNVLAELSPDDRTELFEELPGEVTQRLLNLLSPGDRKETVQFLGYPEESVGRLMTNEYVLVQPDWTVDQALEHIRKYGRDAETINMIYVVDDHSKLIDDIPLRKIILANPESSIRSIMDMNFIAIRANEDQEEAVKMMQHYNLFSMPVTDRDDILLGIVTVDDILDVYQEETTEDVHKSASIVPLEISYQATPVWGLYRRRIGWLGLLAVAGFLSSSVIAAYEHTLTTIVALAFFIPVLIDSGGNTGSQSATLVIRALALGELTPGKWIKVIYKELFVGILLGITLGIILYFWGTFWKGGQQIGMVVGTAMIIIIFLANLIGGLLPLILTKLKLDPAVVSSPLITTLIDATGLFIYFNIASYVLKL